MTPEETTGEFQKVRDETKAAVRVHAYTILVLVVTVLLAAGSSILVTVLLTQRSERKFCAVVISVDDGYRKSLPTTDAGREQARIYSQLRKELGCPPFERKDK